MPRPALLFGLFTCVLSTALDADDAVDFNAHIRPIFVQHCTECHGGVKQAADLSLVYEDSVSAILEPGAADDSELLRRITSDDPDERMPPSNHERLSEHDINRIKAWIDQGATWGKHWAYEIPKRHQRPAVENTTWCRQPIDYFVLSRLAAEKLRPSGDEAPAKWLRRVCLDLTGLPPTIEFRAAFLADLESTGEPAYETVVDKLLASTTFGERWASVWFDQVRYADSRGMGADGRRTIWKYRDWVIDALNADLPYDQFTIKQIAGDLLPNATLGDKIATAVHRLTQSNEEGGTDDEEFRVAAVLDRVNTTWQVWQGTTIGCVQCHHHPYDPFTHEDYYRSVAFFNNTADSDLNDDWPLLRVPINTQEYDTATKLNDEITSLREQIWRSKSGVVTEAKHWTPITQLNATSIIDMAVERTPDGHAQYRTVGTVPTGLEIDLDARLPDSLKQLTAIRITALPLNPDTALADSEWGFMLSQLEAQLVSPGDDKPKAIEFATVVGDEPHPRHDPSGSLNKNNDGFSAFTRIHHPRQAAFILKTPLTISRGSKLKLKLRHKVNSGGSHPLVIKRGHLDVCSNESVIGTINQPELAKLNERLAAKNKEFSAIKSTTVPVMRERQDQLKRPTHIFTRGLFLTKDKQVQPGIPESLLPDNMSVDDRLQLAQWFVDARNPLTARVAVNRFWARIFGQGLVATEEDFGSTGSVPTHPELLDDLSVRFRDDYRWSVKKLLKEIVLSRTYRQTSAVTPELLKRDQSNQLLARGPRNPLDAEIVRDQSLAISGLLVDTMHGPPVHPPLPAGVWRPFSGGDKWNTPKVGEPDRYRRSIYTYIKRSIPYPMFAAFDTPTREFCAPRRLRSNTPLQPLATMNDEAFAECRDAFAERMAKHSAEPAEQIEHGFLLATSRKPTTDESRDLKALLDSVTQLSNRATGLKSVATVILNLDEVLNQ